MQKISKIIGLWQKEKKSAALCHPRFLPQVVCYSLIFPGIKGRMKSLFVYAQGRGKGVRPWRREISRDQHRVPHAGKESTSLTKGNEAWGSREVLTNRHVSRLVKCPKECCCRILPGNWDRWLPWGPLLPPSGCRPAAASYGEWGYQPLWE